MFSSNCNFYLLHLLFGHSRKSGKGKLSPYLALLLSYGGVSEDVLMKFVDDELNEIRMRFSSRQSAIRGMFLISFPNTLTFDSTWWKKVVLCG